MYLEPAWFSMRYQVAEKFSLVKSALIPGNVSSKSLGKILPLKEDQEKKDEDKTRQLNKTKEQSKNCGGIKIKKIPV